VFEPDAARTLPAASSGADPISKRHQQVIIGIGGRRLAFDFYSQVTELNPAPVPVIPVDRGQPGKPRKSRQ
jgi:hypothetical protein